MGFFSEIWLPSISLLFDRFCKVWVAFYELVWEVVVFMYVFLCWVTVWTFILVLEWLLFIHTIFENYVREVLERLFDRLHFWYYYCVWLYDY